MIIRELLNGQEGNFSKGKADGIGTLMSANIKKYTGNWKNDKFVIIYPCLSQDGFGKEEYEDGAYYEGYYNDGVKEGENGVYEWSDGSKYTGEFKNNEFEGEGILQWKDGRTYSGSWN